tara:strand:+ start:77 stop:649 length:573 start_codon:yes stop_codon:yes gene_type:complete
MTQAPVWNWRKVAVDNLAEMQKELWNIVPQVIPNWETDPGQFVHVDVDMIKKFSPLYANLISTLGLTDRWHTSALITTNNDTTLQIHTDVYDPSERCFAFNIPVINCEDSYTVWYSAEDPVINTINPEDGKDKVLFYNEETAVEIDRMPATTCAFVNNHTPHRPVTEHKKFRTILSSRFDPELFDYNFRL